MMEPMVLPLKANNLKLTLMLNLFYPFTKWLIIPESVDDPVFTYSGGSSNTMTPASCLTGEQNQNIFDH